MRLKHPDMQPAASVRIRFDGQEIEALPGETIAAALAAADIVAVRQARSGAPRGPFCGMGVCFDCLVTVDGRPSQRACLTKIEAGMDVRSAPAGLPHGAPTFEARCVEPPPPLRGTSPETGEEMNIALSVSCSPVSGQGNRIWLFALSGILRVSPFD